MYVIIAPLFSLTSAFFTKTSIVISFIRIMGRTVTWVHKLIACIPVILLLLTSMLACGVIVFFCWPVEKSWRPYLPGKCMNPRILDVLGRSVSGMLQELVARLYYRYPREDTDNGSIQRVYGCFLCGCAVLYN